MANVCMLSTVDNKFDPFEDFLTWFLFDIEKGYDCCGKVARIAKFADDMTQKEIDEENERAIDEIIANDFLGLYKKVIKTITNDQ